MNGMPVNAKIEERISKKTGEKYFCIVVKVSNEIEKLVFLSKAELSLLKLTMGK